MVARRILESEGLEDARSSCDERRPIVREATAQYAARRTNVPPTDLGAYEQSEETIESEDDEPLEPIPEGEEPEEEETQEPPDRWNPPREGLSTSEEEEEPPMVEVELQGNEELPEEEAELGGNPSTEHDTEAEALEIMWACRSRRCHGARSPSSLCRGG